MRGIFIAVAVAMLALVVSGDAAAQNPPQQISRPAEKEYMQSPLPQRSNPTNNFAQPEQPTSLGEVARLARARRGAGTDPKPSRVYDDDNFPRSAEKGAKAPEIYVASSQTNGSSRPQLAGKVMLLDFWASWCGPCRSSLPDLKQFVSAYGGRQLEVVSISEDESERDWQNFVAKNQMNWPQQHDPDGTTARRFGVRGLPTYILIGSNGTILERYVGASPQESLADRIGPDLRRALEGKP
jgi:cytochrome c biogenesis protein CcmG, thiol:disulfide interchange protein DsbE